MDKVTRGCALLLMCMCAAGCAPPASVPSVPAPADDVQWGDEYAGVADDADLEDALAQDAPAAERPRASLDALVDGPDAAGRENYALRSLSAHASDRHAAARYRQSAYGRAGAAEVLDAGWLRHAVVGALRPTVGEGALVADARELGSPAVRAAPSASALRVGSSSSRWGSVLGAGVEVGRDDARVVAAAWHPHGDDSTWTAWSACEGSVARTRIGVAYGRTTRRPAGALAILVARAFRSAFLALETARAGDDIACAARVVAGDTWRAAFAWGAPAAPDVPVGAEARERRIAVLERRDAWPGLGSRVVASSLARRQGPQDERRRRIDCSLRARVDEGAQVEAGVRFTETATVTLPSPLDLGAVQEASDWRGRVALRVREHPSPSLEVEHLFRVDAVYAEAALGLAGTWRGSLRRGRLDCRAQASAWGLGPGQLGYLGTAGLPGSGAFTTVSRSGADLTVAVRAGLGRHATIGAEWRRKASGESGVLLAASLGW